MIRDLVLSSPVANVALQHDLAEMTHRLQIRNFKVNEMANKFYANMADENYEDLAAVTCNNDVFVIELDNLIANVTYCFEASCDPESNKYILTDGRITITCNKFNCFTKVDNFDLKFKKGPTGYAEIKTDVKPSELTKILLSDNDSFRRFKDKPNDSAQQHRLKEEPKPEEDDSFPIDTKYKDNYFKRLPSLENGFVIPKLSGEQLKEINDRLAAAIRMQIMNDLGGAVNKIVGDMSIGKLKIKLDNGLKYKVKGQGLTILQQDPVLKQFGYNGGFIYKFNVEQYTKKK